MSIKKRNLKKLSSQHFVTRSPVFPINEDVNCFEQRKYE